MKKESTSISSLSLEEATEILSHLPENEEHFINHESEGINSILKRFQSKGPLKKICSIKKCFAVFLNHFLDYYTSHKNQLEENPQSLEQIKSMMLLVGEAVKKMERFNSLFDKYKITHVNKWKEYQQLQDFYHKILENRKISVREEKDLPYNKWLPEQIKEENNSVMHNIVDLESLKRDEDYELLFIKKGDGSKFYEPHLIKNLKLMMGFSLPWLHRVGKGDDHLLKELFHWKEHALQMTARELFNRVLPLYREYIDQVMPHKDKVLVAGINKAMMALSLTLLPYPDSSSSSHRSSGEYFNDFLHYLNEVLADEEYAKLLTYPGLSHHPFYDLLKRFTLSLSMALFAPHPLYRVIEEEMEPLFQPLSGKVSPLDTCTLAYQYHHQEVIIRHRCEKIASHSLERDLLDMEKESSQPFAPFFHQALATPWYHLKVGKESLLHLHLPCPTQQESIESASIHHPFKAFLRGSIEANKKFKLLLINLQDRSCWKERARSLALEKLSEEGEWKGWLHVISIPRAGDLYLQQGEYAQLHQTAFFLEKLRQEVEKPYGAFYFEEGVKKTLLNDFLPKLLPRLHRLFFSEKNSLSRKSRCYFIDLFYLFLQLKLIDLYQPSCFSLTCKDGADRSAAANAIFFLFLHTLVEKPFILADHHLLKRMLYAPTLFLRERLPRKEEIDRFLSFVKSLEASKAESKEFIEDLHLLFSELYTLPLHKGLLSLL